MSTDPVGLTRPAALMRVAWVLQPAGRETDPTRVLGAADEMFEEMGFADNFWVVAKARSIERVLRETLDEPACDAAWQEGHQLKADDAIEFALRALESDA